MRSIYLKGGQLELASRELQGDEAGCRRMAGLLATYDKSLAKRSNMVPALLEEIDRDLLYCSVKRKLLVRK